MLRVSMVVERCWSSLEISWPPASHGMHLPGVIWSICLRVPSCMVRRKTTVWRSVLLRLCSPTDLRSPSHNQLRSSRAPAMCSMDRNGAGVSENLVKVCEIGCHVAGSPPGWLEGFPSRGLRSDTYLGEFLSSKVWLLVLVPCKPDLSRCHISVTLLTCMPLYWLVISNGWDTMGHGE